MRQTSTAVKEYTWATKPSAIGNEKTVIRITDVGSNPNGSCWYSNGTKWRPINHHTYLYKANAPIVIPADVALPVVPFVTYQIPAGFLSDLDTLILNIVAGKNNVTWQFFINIKIGGVSLGIFSLYNVIHGFKVELFRLTNTTMQLKGTIAAGGSFSGSSIPSSTILVPQIVTVPNLDTTAVELVVTGQLYDATHIGTLYDFTLEYSSCDT